MTRMTIPVFLAASTATVAAFTQTTGRRGFAQVPALVGSSATARAMVTSKYHGAGCQCGSCAAHGVSCQCGLCGAHASNCQCGRCVSNHSFNCQCTQCGTANHGATCLCSQCS